MLDTKQQINIDFGLSDNQVEERMKAGFINTQEKSITKSYKEIFRDNVFTLFNLINALLASLIIFIGSFKNLLFLGVVISNLVIGIIQEIRAKRVLDKLSLITQPYLKVLRNGEIVKLHMEKLVIDDILLLSSGSQICADSIVKEGKVEVNESLLTGESDSIVKNVGDILYSGSFVVSGNAKVQVTHVGKDNYAQSILSDVKVFQKHKSQLRDSINFIIKSIGIVIIPVGILLFSKQFFISDASFADAVVSTVAALIGMIPEGLVLLTSIALAVGSINLARKKTLVQELYCIETLARVDTLFLDKTGTITEGNMRVEEVLTLIPHEYPTNEIIANMMAALADDNATAQAIRNYASHMEESYEVSYTLPFSSARKFSAVTFKDKGTYILGAYEFVNDHRQDNLIQMIHEQTQLGNRVLVLAHTNKEIIEDQIDKNNEIIALLILSDPIRKEAPATLDYFLSQGVTLKVISGDDPLTVHAIAKKAHLKDYENYIDMSKVKDEEIPEIVNSYTIFGRVSPIQKKLMIKAFKKQNHVTAMIGDGVNDVMALKEADCSISVAQGSEAAKSIANLVLLDNNFANMPRIVDEGRRVINNIQRAASLFLVKTTFSTILSILTLFFIQRYPFEPIQLTLISSLTIGIPSFFLALEANHSRVEGNFLLNVLSRALPGALCVVLSIIYVNILSAFVIKIPQDNMSTMCVLLTGACSLLVLYRVCYPFTTKRFLIFIIMTVGFVLAVIFMPKLFSLVRLSYMQFLFTVIGIVAIPFVMDLFFRCGKKFHIKEHILNVGK
ncbi:HAD-IC family P-type ATPase [Amedibacterium intestinale]|uniref:HAD-IC family P-type ATPase n=1 Tax=Amedibacterium intestinale TaxID=2583452 RepID=UPI000E4D684F|nr:HAD-IC family P-type ATPase [Amedibacterium intestinale]RHO19223.1 HAD family hydrolase [Eubacterium sp. AM18-26]RHO22690.1 HAD family hydrolase [Eubacterium sp. AM18-10LB-B]